MRYPSKTPVLIALLISILAAIPFGNPCRGNEASGFHPVTCEGVYPQHLQGICTDDKSAIFWSFTTFLVKTDTGGKVLKKVPVDDHHGDLCHVDGRIYVAVNLGKFNEPAGRADSWVYVYDAGDLSLLSKHAVPEVVHGAGGMAYRDGSFVLVGGLPDTVEENYAYLYTPDFKFVRRHVIASGHTHLGVQTLAFAHGHWWFGCYGNALLKTDPDFTLEGRYEFNCSLGITGAEGRRLFVAKGFRSGDQHGGSIVFAREDDENGLAIIEP